MKLEFDESFVKSLNKINNAGLNQHVLRLIEQIESIETIVQLSNIKKLKGFDSFYRIRKGQYRIGFELIDTETIRFILVAHRKDIYKKFP